MLWVDQTFELYEDAMVFRVLFLFFCLDKQGPLDECNFRHCYGDFFLNGHNHV